MSQESEMRQKVVKALRSMNAVSVENPVNPGTPDVNYVEGWIELKRLKEWPVREDTIVRIKTYTPKQRVWAIRRRRAGGQSWFLLQVGKEWLLLDGAVAAMVVNKVNRLELIRNTVSYWNNGLPDRDLVSVLTNTNLMPFEYKSEILTQLGAIDD